MDRVGLIGNYELPLHVENSQVVNGSVWLSLIGKFRSFTSSLNLFDHHFHDLNFEVTTNSRMLHYANSLWHVLDITPKHLSHNPNGDLVVSRNHRLEPQRWLTSFSVFSRLVFSVRSMFQAQMIQGWVLSLLSTSPPSLPPSHRDLYSVSS